LTGEVRPAPPHRRRHTGSPRACRRKGVLLRIRLALVAGLALATGSAAMGAPPVRTRVPDDPPGPSALLAGFDTLEDSEDRALALVCRPRVFVPRGGGPASLAQAGEREAGEGEARERLGPAWRLESIGRSPGGWVLRGPAVRLPEGTGYAAVRGLAS